MRPLKDTGNAAATFDRALREVAKSRLEPLGYKFDGRRTFRRSVAAGRCAQIVNFQLGQRSLQGRFAVNLGVFIAGRDSAPADVTVENVMEYHCPAERRQRLGLLMPRASEALERFPGIGILFGRKDKWWPFSADAASTQVRLREATDAIERYGLPWIEQVSLSS